IWTAHSLAAVEDNSIRRNTIDRHHGVVWAGRRQQLLASKTLKSSESQFPRVLIGGSIQILTICISSRWKKRNGRGGMEAKPRPLVLARRHCAELLLVSSCYLSLGVSPLGFLVPRSLRKSQAMPLNGSLTGTSSESISSLMLPIT